MKKVAKVIAIAALAVTLSLCLFGCGGKKASFQEEYTQALVSIDQMNADSEAFCQHVYAVWSGVGTDYAGDALQHMLSVPKDFDTYWNTDWDSMTNWVECQIGDAFGWLNNQSFGISFGSDAEEFHAMCMEMQTLSANISESKASLETQVKDIRAKYGDDFGGEIELLYDYYLESCEFADFALEPSGSLVGYASELDDHLDETASSKRAADIY